MMPGEPLLTDPRADAAANAIAARIGRPDRPGFIDTDIFRVADVATLLADREALRGALARVTPQHLAWLELMARDPAAFYARQLLGVLRTLAAPAAARDRGAA